MHFTSKGNSILLLLCSSISFQLMAARPFVTDDAGTVESAKFELETACDYWGKDVTAGICFKHGVTKRMDIGLGLGYIPLPLDQRSFTPAELSLKYALIPDLLAGSFSAALGQQTYSLNAILSKSIGPVCMDVNLGYQTGADMKNADLAFGIDAVYEFKRMGAGLEIGGSGKELNWWQVGGRFQVTHWLVLDAGVGGDFKSKPSCIATTGLWFSFPFNKVNNG